MAGISISDLQRMQHGEVVLTSDERIVLTYLHQVCGNWGVKRSVRQVFMALGAVISFVERFKVACDGLQRHGLVDFANELDGQVIFLTEKAMAL